MKDDSLPICVACGSQYDSPDGPTPARCKICDDPRQFIPPTGQAWTTLQKLREGHENIWAQDESDPRIWWFWTEPKFAIGERAFILCTPSGLILWDLLALIDAATIKKIKSLGVLKAVVISHPHYYTTWATWSAAFAGDEGEGVKVWVAEEDQEWLCRSPPSSPTQVTPGSSPRLPKLQLVKGGVGSKTEILPSVSVVKVGGHFPGSLVLHWERRLFIADSIVTVPSAYTPHPRPEDQTTYAFMWSIPNMIPMTPDQILEIWRALKGLEFEVSYGAFVGMNIRDPGAGMKKRMLQSMKTQVRVGGWKGHEIEGEEV